MLCRHLHSLPGLRFSSAILLSFSSQVEMCHEKMAEKIGFSQSFFFLRGGVYACFSILLHRRQMRPLHMMCCRLECSYVRGKHMRSQTQACTMRAASAEYRAFTFSAQMFCFRHAEQMRRFATRTPPIVFSRRYRRFHFLYFRRIFLADARFSLRFQLPLFCRDSCQRRRLESRQSARSMFDMPALRHATRDYAFAR